MNAFEYSRYVFDFFYLYFNMFIVPETCCVLEEAD